MRFADPAWFALFLLIPIYLGFKWKQRGRQQGLPFAPWTDLKQVTGRPGSLVIFYLMQFAFFSCIVFAMARPQSGREEVKTTQEGIDIMLAVDTSASMLAEDFRPNRLTAAKRVLENFINKQQSNRLGVVVFAGRSFTLMPLSTDYALIADSIKEIHPQIVKRGGTAIGDALSNAIYRFRKDNTTSRAIILLTDGENTVGETEPLVAAQIARQKNIRVHVIGIGKPEGVPVPVINPATGRREYLRDGRGNLYLSRINEEDLKKIASLTGGLYFRADNENSLTAIYDQINAMEKTRFETRKRTIYSEKMHWFLIPGLLFFLLALLLRLKQGEVLELRSGT